MDSRSKQILEYLERLIEQEDKEQIDEEGQMAAPSTDSSVTGGTLPIPPLGKIAKRKSLDDKD